jgi:hypothetical protein
MTTGQKISLSLLISVLLFAGFALLAFSGLFDFVEASFYDPAVRRGYEARVASIAEAVDAYHAEAGARFEALAASDAARRAFLPNQSREDILARDRAFSAIKEAMPGLRGMRVIDADGKRIHYSSFPEDEKRRDALAIVYRNYGDSADDEDFASIAPGPSTKIINSAKRESFIYSVTIREQEGTALGVAVFYLAYRDLLASLELRGALSLGEGLAMTPSGAAIIGLPLTDRAALAAEIGRLWEASGPVAFQPLSREGGAGLVVIGAVSPGGRGVGLAVPEAAFEFPDALKAILLAAFFLTSFLLTFLAFNLRQDRLLVLSQRVKRFQLTLLESFIDEKGEADWARWRAELEKRRDDVKAEIRKGLGPLPKRRAPAVDELIDKSWDEILALLGRRAEEAKAPVTAAQLEDALRRVLASGSIVLPTRPATSAERKAGASGGVTKPEKSKAKTQPQAQRPEEAEAVEELEEAEPVEELEEAEAVEELEEAEAVEELEEAEAAEELEEAEAVEELEEAEAVEELEETEAAEELEEAEAVEELEEAEAVEELEETEAAEELEEAEAVEELEEAEAVEELEEAEVVEELEEAEAVEELEEAEAAEELEEAEAVEELEETEAAEELEEAEAVEELEEAEAVEELEETEAAEELEEAEAVEELEEAEAVEELEETEAAQELEEAEAIEELEEAKPDLGEGLTELIESEAIREEARKEPELSAKVLTLVREASESRTTIGIAEYEEAEGAPQDLDEEYYDDIPVIPETSGIELYDGDDVSDILGFIDADPDFADAEISNRREAERSYLALEIAPSPGEGAEEAEELVPLDEELIARLEVSGFDFSSLSELEGEEGLAGAFAIEATELEEGDALESEASLEEEGSEGLQELQAMQDAEGEEAAEPIPIGGGVPSYAYKPFFSPPIRSGKEEAEAELIEEAEEAEDLDGGKADEEAMAEPSGAITIVDGIAMVSDAAFKAELPRAQADELAELVDSVLSEKR